MSHLKTLCNRITTYNGKDKNSRHFQDMLLNLAEYMLYFDNWTIEEGMLAKKIMKDENFIVDLKYSSIETKLREIYKDKSKYVEEENIVLVGVKK